VAEAGRFAEAKLDAWSRQLEQLARSAEVGDRAIVGAGLALAAGKNPVWGAVRAAWSGAGVGARVGIVTTVVLLAVLAPVVLLLLLLALLVVAVVMQVRARRPG
jgi:hypothetical protein